LVRVSIRISRLPEIDLSSRASVDGMCTDGRSIRHDTSLSTRASFWSFLTPREPTPNVFTSVAGTTRTSWPAAIAASATRNASALVSRITRLGDQPSIISPSLRVGCFFSSTIVPFDSRTQTWDSLPPRSMATCLMAALL
jgi:hypothetical protein